MEEEKENRPMSAVISDKTGSGRPVRNTKRLDYQLMHSGKISETKGKTSKITNNKKTPKLRGGSNKTSEKTISEGSKSSAQVPDKCNQNCEEGSDSGSKIDLQITKMDTESNVTLQSDKESSEDSEEKTDKETDKISVTIQQPNDEVDLYIGNKSVNIENEETVSTENVINAKTEDEENINADVVSVSLKDEGNINTESERSDKTEIEGNGNFKKEDTAKLQAGDIGVKDSKIAEKEIMKDTSTVEKEEHINEEPVLKRPVRNAKRPNYSLLHKGPSLDLNTHETKCKVSPVGEKSAFMSEKDVNGSTYPTCTDSSQLGPKQNEAGSSPPNLISSEENKDSLEEDSSSTSKKRIRIATKRNQNGAINSDETDKSEEESEQESSDQKALTKKTQFQKEIIVTLQNFFNDNHLNLEPRSPTKADGNCFFRSIVDQLELHEIPDQPSTHKKLRLEISNFLLHLPDNVMQTTVDVVFKGKKAGLKNLAYRQKKPGQFVDNNGIMVMATGLFLKRQIHVHSKTQQDCHCVTKIDGGEGSENLDPLTIFYFQDHQHYQSICKTV